MPDDDFGVVVGRDHRRGAGTCVILVRPTIRSGKAPLFLLEPGACGARDVMATHAPFSKRGLSKPTKLEEVIGWAIAVAGMSVRETAQE